MLKRTAGYKFIADIFLPNRCALCGRVISWEGLTCPACGEKMPLLKNKTIEVSGTDGGTAAFSYEGKITDLIYRMKDSGESDNFAELCAGIICERLALTGLDLRTDIVTAVPMSVRKRVRRGYNQAKLLAEFVADILGKKTDYTLLERNDDSTEQHHLSQKEREIHARKVYRAASGHNDISGKNILIVDDVITTGATVRTCAEKLREIGAAEVYCCGAAASVLKDRNK